MTQPEPPHALDVTFLLHAAELLDRDPQVDDYGPLYAAAARVDAAAHSSLQRLDRTDHPARAVR